MDTGTPPPPEGFTPDVPEGFTLDMPKSMGGISSLPSMPEKAPAFRPAPLNQVKVHGFLDSMPTPLSEEVKKEAIERQRGTIRPGPVFSPTEMIRNIPENVEHIVRDTGSLIMNTGRLIKNAATDHEELNKQLKPAVEVIDAIKQDWGAMFRGETPSALDKTPMGQAVTRGIEKVNRMGVFKAGLKFIEEKPVDAALITQAAKSAIGSGTRVTAETVLKAAPKGSRIANGIEKFLSTDRKPLVFEMPAESQVTRELKPGEVIAKEGRPSLANQKGEVAFKIEPPEGYVLDDAAPKTITETVTEPVKTIEFPREYSKDPLSKYIYQKSFDKVLDIFPNAKKALINHKAEKLINQMRNRYDTANFQERVNLQNEVLKQISTLSKEEQAIVVPYLEGRLSLAKDPSEAFKNFETWYRDLSGKIQTDLSAMGKLEPNQIRERLYLPLTKATGLSTEQIIAELGDFTPAYVHHAFPKTFTQKMGSFFADTTGKRYTPGFLKRARGVEGYTEDLKEILPKWTAEYVKFKNTEAFLNDFTGKFGIPVNIKNVRQVEGGLQVGDKVYRGYKIVAPDGILNFYRGKIDFYKEVSKRLEGLDMDEAIGEVLKNALEGAGKDFMGVSKNRKVFLVPENIVKRLESYATPLFGSQRIQNAVKIVYDKPVQVWKDFTLAAAPRWIKNNVLGDIMLNTMEGVGPLSYGRSFRAKYHDVIPDELLKASFANTMKYNPQLGLAARNTIGKFIQAIGETKGVRAASRVKDFGYALNTMFEQPFVRALYVKLAREKAVQMLKAERAAVSEESILAKMADIKNNPALKEPLVAKVEKTLPVFEMSGNFERKYLKRLMPFYNWYKFMAKYAVTLPVNHPFKTVGARGLGALSEGQREEAFKQMFPYMAREIDESGIPDRYDNLWPVKGPDENGKATFFNTRGINIFTTVEDLTKGEILNMLSPIIKLPIERAQGRESFSGREYKTGEAGVNFKGKEDQAPPLGEHILSQFPQYQLLKQTLVPAKQYDTGTIFNPEPILDKITGEYKYPIDSVEKWLNFMGIDKKTLDIRKTWDAYRKEKATAIGQTFDKYQSKAETALSFEDIKGIFDQIKADPKKWNAILGELKDSAQQTAKQKKELSQKIKAQ